MKLTVLGHKHIPSPEGGIEVVVEELSTRMVKLGHSVTCFNSDISECVEVVEDKGVTFQKGNIEDLKEKLEWLINHKVVVEKYKNEAGEFICKKYNWDDVVEKTMRVYE